MKSYEDCAGKCVCEFGTIEGRTFYRCNYGNCNGYKCEKCGRWAISNVGENCSLYDDE